MKYLKWFAYFKFALFSILSILLDLVSRLFLNWFVVMFSDKDGNLPKRLYWFQTFDNTLYEGQYCAERELAATGTLDTWSNFQPNAITWWSRYLNRAFWLLRNSCYGFSYYLFGIPWVKDDWTIVTFIDTPEKVLKVFRSKDGHFNVYYHGTFGMLKIGWKASSVSTVVDGVPTFSDRNGMGGKGRIPHVISYNPLKRKSLPSL